MNKRYFIQAHRIKFRTYLQYGLIMPDMFLKYPEDDTQSKYLEYLLISSGVVSDLKDDEVLIEIVLDEDEETKIDEISYGIYLYHKPLGISRIKSVFVKNREKRNSLISIIDNTSDFIAFNKKLIKTITKKEQIISLINFEDKTKNNDKENLKQKINKYNKLLGLFAFIKNSDVYYFDKNLRYKKYSNVFLNCLYKLLRKSEHSNCELFKFLNEHKDLKDILERDISFDEESVKELLQNEDKKIQEVFERFLKLPMKNKILKEELANFDDKFFYMGLIYIFKGKNIDGNKIKTFKQEIEKYLPVEKKDIGLGLLGMYYGYSKIIAKEYINIKDKYIQKVFDERLKFDLSEKMDYVVIESIYKYVFNDKNMPKSFEYLSITEESPNKLPKDSVFKKIYKYKEDLVIDGVKNIEIYKKDYKTLLEKYNNEISFKDYLIVLVKKYFSDLIYYQKEDKPSEPYCKKEEVTARLEQNMINEDELIKVILIDKK